MGLAQPFAIFHEDKENFNPYGQQQSLNGLPGSGQQPGAQLLKAPPRPCSNSVPKGRTPLADITKLCVGSVSAVAAAAAAVQGRPALQLPSPLLAAAVLGRQIKQHSSDTHQTFALTAGNCANIITGGPAHGACAAAGERRSSGKSRLYLPCSLLGRRHQRACSNMQAT
jgi:hypothetical protein